MEAHLGLSAHSMSELPQYTRSLKSPQCYNVTATQLVHGLCSLFYSPLLSKYETFNTNVGP